MAELTITIPPAPPGEKTIRLELDADVPDPAFIEFDIGGRKVRYVRDDIADEMLATLRGVHGAMVYGLIGDVVVRHKNPTNDNDDPLMSDVVAHVIAKAEGREE